MVLTRLIRRWIFVVNDQPQALFFRSLGFLFGDSLGAELGQQIRRSALGPRVEESSKRGLTDRADNVKRHVLTSSNKRVRAEKRGRLSSPHSVATDAMSKRRIGFTWQH
jgi:hypothetical protein